MSDKAIDLAATDESNVQRNQQRFSGSNTSEDKGINTKASDLCYIFLLPVYFIL